MLENLKITERIKNNELPKYRIYIMKFVYGMIFFSLGYRMWSFILNTEELIPAMDGVAYSFWATYAVMMGFGLRYPTKLLPLLILQLFYKSVWILIVALPLKTAGQLDVDSANMLQSFTIAVVIDLIVIPWPYVFRNYIKNLFLWKSNKVKTRG